MQPMKHQEEKAEECWNILKEKGYVYLAGKPRSGKTYTAILTAEKSSKIHSILVLCPKAAIPGWKKFTEGNSILSHSYYITNYEQAHKITGKFDLVIIDESHNLGKLGKPNTRILNIRKLCKDLPHIHLSGTAIVESPNGIFHQMWISKYNPFKFKNFYEFFRFYGKPYYIKAMGRDIQQYDKADLDRLMPLIDEFTVYMTQEDAGIDTNIQATDVVHYVELSKDTKALYNYIQEHQMIELTHGHHLVCDSVMKLRTSLHMIESGVVKIDEDYIELGNTEKIDYIKETFGDSEDVGIMCNFVGERRMLERHFTRAKIYSSTSHAEGVDLSHLHHFVIMSSGYSGAKFIQRRERIINVQGSNTLKVHHIIVKGAISEQVYKSTSKKKDFNNSTYERAII